MASGLPAHVEESDLISYGLLGLIGAIERYDPAREIKFETFAVARVKGAIIDELRSLDWVPRSVRARAREVETRPRGARGQASADAQRRGDGGPPGDERRGVPRCAARDRQLVGSRARRPLDLRRPRGRRRPDLDPRHDPGPERDRPRGRGAYLRAEGPAGRRDRVPAGPRAPGDRPLLLREPHPARDRRGARGHRVTRIPAPHQGRARPALRFTPRYRVPQPASE